MASHRQWIISRCTSWMRAVRSCGTHRWTSAARAVADPAAAFAGERDDVHLALVRRDDRRDDVGGIARRRDREQHVALGAQRAHLLREHLLERVVVRDGGEDRSVGGQRNRRQLRALALEAADHLGGEMLGVGRRAAVAAGEDLAVGEEARREQVRGAGERRGKRIGRLELQLRAVGEMRADARDVIHNGRRNRSIVAIFTLPARVPRYAGKPSRSGKRSFTPR